MLYTGMRSGEIRSIKKENIFLDENYMIGGIKTEAGKGRIIPIHPKIKDLIFDNTSGKDFDFESSIDKETYNQVVLDYVNDKEKKLEKYQVFDSENITKWGLLQYFEKVNRSNATEAERRERANKMLKYYNQRTKTLKLKGIFGDVRIRGGSSFIVYMDIAEFKLANYMLVDKVTHKFGFKEYFMDLDLEGKIGKEEGHNGEIRTSTDTNDK